jgi:hypothetical protein
MTSGPLSNARFIKSMEWCARESGYKHFSDFTCHPQPHLRHHSSGPTSHLPQTCACHKHSNTHHNSMARNKKKHGKQQPGGANTVTTPSTNNIMRTRNTDVDTSDHTTTMTLLDTSAARTVFHTVSLGPRATNIVTNH